MWWFRIRPPHRRVSRVLRPRRPSTRRRPRRSSLEHVWSSETPPVKWLTAFASMLRPLISFRHWRNTSVRLPSLSKTDLVATDNFGSGLKVSYLTDGTDIVYGNVEMFVHTAAVNGIRIETPSGVSIGEDAMALVGSVSPELKADYSGDGRTWSVVYDVATWWGLNTTEPKQYGARAGVDDGALSLIMVPANVGEMHGTC